MGVSERSRMEVTHTLNKFVPQKAFQQARYEQGRDLIGSLFKVLCFNRLLAGQGS
jgi:hypothetical protein